MWRDPPPCSPGSLRIRRFQLKFKMSHIFAGTHCRIRQYSKAPASYPGEPSEEKQSRVLTFRFSKHVGQTESAIRLVRIVIRLLDKSARLYSLQELGMDSETLLRYRNSIRQEHGLVLVTGADSGFVGIWCSPLMRFRPDRPSQPLPVCVSHRTRNASQSTRPEGFDTLTRPGQQVVSAFQAFTVQSSADRGLRPRQGTCRRCRA